MRFRRDGVELRRQLGGIPETLRPAGVLQVGAHLGEDAAAKRRDAQTPGELRQVLVDHANTAPTAPENSRHSSRLRAISRVPLAVTE